MPFDCRPSDLQRIVGNCKRRRIDEDIVKEMSGGLKTGRCYGAAQYGRATGLFDEASARTWETNRVKSHVVSSARRLKCKGVTGFTEDASTNGCPKEDTEVHLVWDAESNIGAVLPLTVTVLLFLEKNESVFLCFGNSDSVFVLGRQKHMGFWWPYIKS